MVWIYAFKCVLKVRFMGQELTFQAFTLEYFLGTSDIDFVSNKCPALFCDGPCYSKLKYISIRGLISTKLCAGGASLNETCYNCTFFFFK